MLTSKSFFFPENAVQQDENKSESKWCLTVHRFSMQISASCVNDKSHFSKLRQVIFCKFQRARTEVGYITNDRPGEPLTRK